MRYKILTMSNTVFATWVRDARERKRLSQTELAETLGVKPTHISRIESGERGASIDLLIKLAEYFKYPLEELIYIAAGYEPMKKQASEKVIKTAEEKIKGLKRENQERALDYLDFLAQQEEQQENNAATSKKKTPRPETT